MFIRASALLLSVVTLAGVATAVPTALEARSGGNNCGSGSVQCCNSYQSSETFPTEIWGILGIVPPSTGTQIGFTCSPVTVGGVSSGSACTTQTACCSNDHFSGTIVTGCSPTVINA